MTNDFRSGNPGQVLHGDVVVISDHTGRLWRIDILTGVARPVVIEKAKPAGVDAEAKLRALCDPLSEGMADHYRLNAFIGVGLEAADEIRRLKDAANQVGSDSHGSVGGVTKES